MSDDKGQHNRLLHENERLQRRVEELEAEAKRFTVAEEKLEVSEARLLEAQKVAHLGSWEWDVALDVITASQEFYRLFDVEPDQIARFQQFVEWLHPDDRERVGTEVNEALRQNRIYDTDYRVRLRAGGWRDIHARGQLFTDASGKPVRLAGTCIDISERKQAEAAVRASEERARATLYSIGDAVMATDAEGRISRMNPVAERLIGWTEAEAQGRPLDEVFCIVNEDTRAVVESPVARVLREGQVVGLANHTVLIAKSGEERPIADSGAPIRNEKGETTGVVLVFRDQSQERTAQRVLQESERRYRTLAESLPHLVWTCRADGTCDYLSPRWVDYTGIPEADQLDYGWLKQLHPDDRERVIAEWSEGAPRGGVFDIEFRIRRADGVYRWFKTRAIPLLDEGGRVVKWFGSNSDIDDHKRTQQELESLARFPAENPNPVLRIRNDGKIIYANPSSGDLLVAWSCAVGALLPSQLRDLITQSVSKNTSATLDVACNSRVYSVLFAPVPGTDYINLYGQDVTDRRQAGDEIRLLNASLEQRVRERTAELEESNRELEAFSYSVSHDLRAPLRAIDGFTRILADEYAQHLDAEAIRLCSVVRENAKGMSRLIDDLLAFSRLGRAEMSLASIDMGAMASAVFHELTTPEGRARIDFQVDHLPSAIADPALMRQVWMNLLSNAIKFSSKQERAVIKVSAQQGQGETVYTVEDDGAGFEMQYVDKLFGVFQRLHSAKDFEGTGVGLALVQRVIRRHGGRVWATGEPDKGATFCFALQQTGA
jgi:PAS domain S-box-containing protein